MPTPAPPPAQIGVKSQLGGATAQLSLFLGNKASEALAQVVLAVPPSPAFALQLGPVPAVLEPKKQVLPGRRVVGWWMCVCVVGWGELPGRCVERLVVLSECGWG